MNYFTALLLSDLINTDHVCYTHKNKLFMGFYMIPHTYRVVGYFNKYNNYPKKQRQRLEAITT